MREGISRLSERERETLRLLAQGYDAKSAALALGISLHAVNERLREARRKLGVSSSREAARLLASRENGASNFSGDKQIGVGAGGRSGSGDIRPDGWAAGARRPFLSRSIGIAMILLFAAAIGAWALSGHQGTTSKADAPPRVVSTSPAAGSIIPPGPFELSVTFDRPMMDGSYSFVQKSADTYPRCATKPVLSRDARTFTLHCTAEAGKLYEIWFNNPPYMNFRGSNGVPAQPFQLLFRTRKR